MKFLTVLFLAIILSVSCFAQRWVDTEGNQVLPKVDAVTGAVLTIDNFTSKINDGKAFMYATFDTVAAADTLSYHLYADSTFHSHVKIEFQGTLLTIFEIFEDCTIDTSDTLTTWNIDRSSSISASTYLGSLTYPQITAFGDSIIQQSFGGASAATGKQEYELILNSKTHYVFDLISGANNNVISLILKWYEHTDIH